MSQSADASAASAASAPRHAKLDGVLYRFYAKTVALITSERLAPFEPATAAASASATSASASTSPLTGAESMDDAPASAHGRSGSERSASGEKRRISKWFELDLHESDLFREELRLWRVPSSFIPGSVLDRLEAGETTQFPAYVPLLVVDVILDLSRLAPGHVVRLKGVEFRESTQCEAQGLNGICLERWKLAFDIHGAPAAPELATVYQRSVAHFRELDTRLRALPSSALTLRLRQGSASGGASDDALLRTGVRLSTDEAEAEAVLALDRSLEGGFADVRAEAFEPIHTALGSLTLRVEYRADVEFEASDAQRLAGLQDIEVDEDYFRPTMARHTQPVEPSAASGAAAVAGERPKSLLSTTANKRVSALTAGRAAALASPGISSTASSPGPIPPPVEALSRSPALSSSGSVFSTSVPGKPVAGLSSLRHNAPLAGTSPVLTRGTSATSSTGIASALSSAAGGGGGSEAAFLAQGRRTSTGERRLRTLSSMSSERSSPPSPTTSGTTPGLGLAGASPQSALRPSFSRTAGFPALRSGSFSPSSPSPLAQQMNAHRSGGGGEAGAQPASLSSSPGFRSYMSTTPNLRSVFQSYAPSPHTGSGFISASSRVSPRSSALGGEAGRNATPPAPDEPSTSPASRLAAAAGGGQPTVAPQMIKRYSSTFSYRQGRQYASTGTPGSVTGSDSPGASASASASGAAAGEGAYSRSWQARLEQRQSFSSGTSGAFQPRSMGREEGGAMGAAASGTGAFVGSLSPRMTRRRMSTLASGQDDEIDDLVRMIDSRVDLARDSTPPTSSVASPPGAAPRPTSSLARGPSPAFIDPSASASGSGSGSGTFPRRSSTGGAFSPGRGGAAAPTLSRVQVNEMLSRMAASVNRGVSAVAGSPDAAGGAAVASGSGGAGGGAFARSPLSAPPVSISGLSRASAAAGSSSSSPASAAGPITAGARPVFVRPPHAHVAAYDLEGSSSSPLGSLGLGRGTPGSGSGGSASASVSTSTHGHAAAAAVDAQGAGRHRPSTGSLEMYSQSYDDEAVGRLELQETDEEAAEGQRTNDAELANFLARRRHGNGNGGNGHATSDY